MQTNRTPQQTYGLTVGATYHNDNPRYPLTVRINSIKMAQDFPGCPDRPVVSTTILAGPMQGEVVSFGLDGFRYNFRPVA